MVLPTPAADDQLRPETAWIEAILRTLRLASGGVLVHVDHAGPERLGELARALLAEWPDVDVLDGVAGLETAPAGSTRVLVPRVEEALWLNLNRPIVSRRSLKVVLWCDRATTVELSRRAPDFFDWISAHVDCPSGFVPFALAGVRAALQAKAPGIHWMGGSDERAKTVAAGLLAACAPGTTVRWVDVEGPYEEVVQEVESVGGTGVCIGAAVDAQWKVWRFRWACAEVKSACLEVVLAPGLECPGFWPVHDQMMPLGEAWSRLSKAGAARPGLCATLVDQEPGAVEIVARLLGASVSEQEILRLVNVSGDPEAALVDRARQCGCAPDPNSPASLRARLRAHGSKAVRKDLQELPTWENEGIEVEEALRCEPKGSEWFVLASTAFRLGDSGAAAEWALRELSEYPEARRYADAIARDISTGDFKGATSTRMSALQELSSLMLRQRGVQGAAGALLDAAKQEGVTSERFATCAVLLAVNYVWAGAPQVAIPLLSKALGPPLEDSVQPSDDESPDSFPFLDEREAKKVAEAVRGFLGVMSSPLSPEIAELGRVALLEALLVQGRFEEADQIARHSTTK